MGCIQSAPATAESVAADAKAPNVSMGNNEAKTVQFDESANTSTQLTSDTPWSSGSGPHQGSMPRTSLDLPGTPRPLPPARRLEWKLSQELIDTGKQVERMDEIKSIATDELGVPKARIGLLSCTHLWINTRTGAFSPALQLQGSPFHGNLDQFHIEKRADPYVMEDARLDPRCANHPGVRGRPNMRFYVGAPMISRGHMIGLMYLYETHVRTRPPQEKLDLCMKLTADAVWALQEDMYAELGATSPEEAALVELPALWIDTITLKWKIVGVNKEWVQLTGVNLDKLVESEGLLDAMVPSNEAALHNYIENADLTDQDVSIPAILSPCSQKGSSLQFVLSLKPAKELPAPKNSIEMLPGAVLGPTIWKVEVHCRIQAAADSMGNLEVTKSGFFAAFSASSVSGSAHLSAQLSEGLGTGSGSTSRQDSATRHGDLSTISPHSTIGIQSLRHSTGRSSSTSPNSSHLLAPAASVLAVGAMHIPPRLSSLQLGPLLGKGSFGSVYWGQLGSTAVAIKVMQQAPGPDAVDQLWNAQYEAMLSADLSCPYLVRTLDWCSHADESGGVMWIVLELCDKGSLSAAIKDHRLRIGQSAKEMADMHAVVSTALEVARGMAYLHHHDILHGDLSSNNVMLVSADNDRGYIAKVTDFGLSRALRGADDIATKTVGTISHMPPELIIEGVVAKTGDTYSFGVMLWEMFTGQRAWGGSSQAQVIFAITCRNECLKIPDSAPPAYAALMNACLSPDRTKRPEFDEIVETLEKILAELPTPLNWPTLEASGEAAAAVVVALEKRDSFVSPFAQVHKQVT